MAIHSVVASVDIEAANRCFAELRTIDALLGDEPRDAVAALRSDPTFEPLLEMLRLFPDDEELWSGVLEPRTVDHGRESAAADRLTILLASLSDVVAWDTVVPYFVTVVLDAAGWAAEEAHSCIYGRRLPLVLVEHELIEPASMADMADWLPGGCVGPSDAAAALAKLDASGAQDADLLRSVAEAVHVALGLDVEQAKRRLEANIDGLHTTLQHAATNSAAITWIVID